MQDPKHYNPNNLDLEPDKEGGMEEKFSWMYAPEAKKEEKPII
jgi:hypothetical protein